MSTMIVDIKIVHDLAARLHRLESEIHELKRSIHASKGVSDESAMSRIESYLHERKKKAQTRVSLLDISFDLGLPAEQADRVMRRLQPKGIVEVE